MLLHTNTYMSSAVLGCLAFLDYYYNILTLLLLKRMYQVYYTW